MQIKTYLSSIVVVALATSLCAQDETAQTIRLETITLTASPVHGYDSFSLPAQVDTVSSEVIAQKSSASLGKILEDIPGVNNIATGPQAGKPVIRGLTGERVKVLSNGSATDFQTYGIRHIANIDPFFAQSIEVVRGAQGVLYGSDALGGVVNVLSPELLSTSDGSTLYKGEIAGEYHTNNNEWMGGVKTQIAKGKYALNLGVAKRKADNYKTASSDTYKAGDPAGTLPLFAGELPFTNFENESAFAALGYSDDWGSLSLQHTYWQSYQNYLGHNALLQAVSSAGQNLANNETQIKAKIIASEWLIKPSISHTLNTRKTATNTPYEEMQSVEGTNLYLDMQVQRTDAKLALVHPEFGVFDGEIGIEGYDKKQTLKEGTLAPSADEKGFALYIFEEADIGKWVFQAGLRTDTRKIEVPLDGENTYFVTNGFFDSTNNSKSFSATAASLGLTYKITDTLNLATNLSRGFRAPSIFELYAGGLHGGVQAFQLGNPNLQEEISMGADIALRYKDEKNMASLTLHQTSIENYMFLENTDENRTISGTNYIVMQNQQTDARVQGIELAFESKITDKTTVDGTFEIIEGKDTQKNRPLPLMPANNLKLAIHQGLPNFAFFHDALFSIDYKYVDKKDVGGSYEPFAQYNTLPFGSADTPSYSLWGLEYRTSLALLDKKPTFGIRVDNLLDEKYRDFLDTYKGYALSMGRNISFDLRIPF